MKDLSKIFEKKKQGIKNRATAGHNVLAFVRT